MNSARVILFLLLQFSSPIVLNANYEQSKQQSGRRFSADHFQAADSLYKQGLWHQAIIHFELLVTISDDSTKLASTLNRIGLCYKKIGELDSARFHYDQSLEISLLLKDFKAAITKLRNLGNAFRSQGKYLQALDHYLQSLDYSDSLHLRKSSSITLMAIGNVHENLNRHELALSAYQKATYDLIQLGDSTRVALTLNNTGDLYQGLGSYDSALFYYKKAMLFKSGSKDLLSRSYTLSNLGSLFEAMGQQDSAEVYLLNAYKIQNELKAQRNIAITANHLARLYLNQQKPLKANGYIKTALSYALEQNNLTVLMNNLEIQSDYYQQIGDYREAHKLLDQWSIMRDSVFNQEKVKVIELQSQYDLKRKEVERQFEEERADVQASLAENRLLTIRLVFGLALTFLLFTLVFLYQRNKIGRLNNSLKLLNSDMLHRKRNDYSRLLTSLELAGFSEIDTIRNMLFASTAVDNTLLRDLQKEVYIKPHLEGLIEDLGDSLQISEKKVHIKTLLQDMLMSGEQLAKVSFIINELVTNSIKHSFRSQGGSIKLELSRSQQVTTIFYTDDGAPIPDDINNRKNGMGQQLIAAFLKSLKAQSVRTSEDGINIARIEFNG